MRRIFFHASHKLNSFRKDMFFRTRKIFHHGKRTTILLQNANGPCPLLAIYNSLSLRGNIDSNFVTGRAQVTLEQLNNELANYVLERCSLQTESNNTRNTDKEHNIEEALCFLPKMATGLNINIRFNGPEDYEPTAETAILDLFRLRILHGWIVDGGNPAEAGVANAIGRKSINAVLAAQVERAVRHEESEKKTADNAKNSDPLPTQPSSPNDVGEWLKENRSQLTQKGIQLLLLALQEHEVGILFRNNHFSVITKFNNTLLTLVTDEALAEQEHVVWETLEDVSGRSSRFVGPIGYMAESVLSQQVVQGQVLAPPPRPVVHARPVNEAMPENQRRLPPPKKEKKKKDDDTGCVLA